MPDKEHLICTIELTTMDRLALNTLADSILLYGMEMDVEIPEHLCHKHNGTFRVTGYSFDMPNYTDSNYICALLGAQIKPWSRNICTLENAHTICIEGTIPDRCKYAVDPNGTMPVVQFDEVLTSWHTVHPQHTEPYFQRLLYILHRNLGSRDTAYYIGDASVAFDGGT